jgi:5-formyltetrahydrofolate cyclo-ligase
MKSPKETLRAEIKNRLKCVSREEFCSQGAEAAVLLRSSPSWARFSTLFLFLSMDNSEIDTQSLLEAAFKDGKRVFAPKVEGDKLVFYPLLSAKGPWRKDSFGIREPEDWASEDKMARGAEDFPALILTPGLAFDREGNRLGRGKGYYDRFFAELDAEGRSYTALGLSMDFQIIEKVPVEENDKKMNGLLTGTELMLLSEFQ